ncbi:MAG: succinate dehydrogenase / fumarate reductase cytochrome b subunit [Saprospiraceae bacterium]|jgi:succinate dehydrogenase / fumarate reductase cytochrome b subunit
MTWLTKFLTSSIGRKLIMSLTGLFLVLFLVVHLAGNLQLLLDDGGNAFNGYAYLMTHNPLIKIISYGNYFFIVLHAIQGILIALANRKAKGTKYAVSTSASASWSSKNMALLGTLIFAFICIHMGDFWYRMHFDAQMAMVTVDGFDHPVKDLYARVTSSFSIWWLVIIYLIGMAVLSFHLWHGFQSAFQTLGINHKKYTPAIHSLGKLFALVIPIGFAIIPIVYFGNAMGWWKWFT